MNRFMYSNTQYTNRNSRVGSFAVQRASGFRKSKSSTSVLIQSIQSKILILCLLFVVMEIGNVSGVTKTWSVGTGNWNTAASWSPTGVPATGDDVVINSSGTVTLDLLNATCNNFSLSSGTFRLNNATNNTLSIAGNYSQTGGTFDFNSGSSGTSTLNLAGNFTQTTGSGTMTTSGNVANGLIVFNGNGTQTLNFTNSRGADYVKYTVSATCNLKLLSNIGLVRDNSSNYNGQMTVNGSIDLGTFTITNFSNQGQSIFTLGPNATLITANVGGIDGSIPSNNATRTFSTGSNYIFNGSAAQVTGVSLMQNIPANITINNTAGVTLSVATTISGLLTMTNGILNMANTNLTVGSLTGTSNLTNSSGTVGSRTVTIGSDGTSPAAYSGTISNGTASGVSVTKTGSGILILSGANTYSGLTTINGGILQIGNVAALGTIVGGTTVTSGGVLDLNGISLSTAEPLTLNGTGISNGGALINSSATAVTFNGAITLASASSIGTLGNISLGAGITGGKDLTKTGTGILFLGTSNSTLNSLTIGSGTFNSTSNTLNMAGNFTNNSIFTHNNGTVTFNGTAAQMINSGGSTFNNFSITNTGGTCTAASYINVIGAFTTSTGSTLDMGTNLLTLNTVNHSGTLKTQNTSPVPFTSGITWGGNVIFNGTSAQTIPASTFSKLTLTNGAGATLGGGVNIGGALVLTSGLLTTNSNSLAITNTSTGAVTGSSATGYVNGSLQWTLTTGNSYLFPVGDATNYRPFELNSITGISPVATVTMSSSGALTPDGSLLSVAPRNWSVQLISGTITSATVRITESGLMNSNVVASSSTQSGNYTNIGGNSIGTTVTSNAGIPITSPTYFAIGNILTAAIALSDNIPQVTAASVAGGTTNVVLHTSALTCTNVNATLTGMTCTTAGTYMSTDITNLKVYYSTNSTFTVGGSTLLSTLTTPGNAGLKTFPTFTSQVIANGTTGYIFITADVPVGATVGNTISLNALTTSNFTFTLSTVSGSTTVGGTKTIAAITYYNKTNGANALQLLSSWNTKIDGTGTPPTSFAANNQLFNIYNGTTATIGALWTVSGTNSKVVLGNPSVPAINFTVPSAYSFSGPIDIASASTGSNTLTIQNSTIPALGILSTGSTVDYDRAGNQTVTGVNYYNLTMSNSGTKTLQTGTTTISGNLTFSGTATCTAVIGLTIGGDVILGAGSTFTSGTFTHSVSGNWTNNGGTFTPGAGTINFTGNSSSINGTAATQNFNNIILNKISGQSLDIGGSTTTLTVGGAFTETLGDFTASPTMSVTGALTLTSGTFIAGSSLTVSGNWTNNGGIFSPGSGTVTFSGTTSAINGSAVSQSFNNLILNKSSNGQTLSISGSTTSLTIGGSFTETLGNFTAPATMIITGTTTLTSGTLTTGASITTSGDWTNNGGTFTPGMGTVTFAGNTSVINGSTGTQSFNNIILSKTSGQALSVGGSTATLNVAGTLNVGDGSIFNVGGITLAVAGTTTIGNGTSGTLNITSITGSKTFAGAITINSGATLAENVAEALTFGSDVLIKGTLTENGTAVIGIAGSLTNNGTYTASTGTHTFTGTTKSIGGTNTISIPTVTFTGTYTNTGTLTVPTLLTITGVTLTNNGTITATTALSGSGGLLQGATGTLYLGGTSGITTLNASTNSGNTVNYTGTTQTIKAINYYNLILSGTGADILPSTSITINGDFTLSGTGTTTARAALTIGGTFDNGAGTTFAAGTFTHTIAGDCTNNGILNANTSTISLKGNWTNNGTFTANTSSISLNGTSQSINGATNFNNLTLAGSGTKIFANPITTSAAFTINTGVIASLGNGLTHTAHSLVLGGNGEGLGSWGGVNSGATFINSTFFDGSTLGVVNVATSTCLAGSWTGYTNTDWNTATNWCDGSVPGPGTNVSIPSVTNQPIISTEALCNNLSISSGATLTILGSYTLTISGSFTNSGTFVPNSSTVIYNANGAQTVGAVAYNSLTLMNTGTKTTTGVTVNGILSMEGTATLTTAPTYGPNATLQYNTLTPRTSGNEWSSPFTSTGGINISGNALITMNSSEVVNAPLNINPGSTLSTSGNNYPLTLGGDFIKGGTLSAGSSLITIAGTANQSIAGFTTTGGITMQKTAGTSTLMGAVSGGALTLNGTNSTLRLGTATGHTFTSVTLNSDTLRLGATEALSNSLPFNMGGGTLSTGDSIGFTETVGTLNLIATSTIALGTRSHILTFASSNALSWNSGTFLTVTGWNGNWNGTSGTAGQLFFGNNNSGLTATQLGQLCFYDGTNYFTANMLSTGEVVPGTHIIPSLSYIVPPILLQNVAITSLSPTVNIPYTNYTVSPALPTGLTLNPSTGIITGTPTLVSGATDYTITAKAGTNIATFVINITVHASSSRYSVATGSWNSTTTWSATSKGTPGASVPIAGDLVFIEYGNSVTITADATCASLSFTAATSTNTTLSINPGINLNVSGPITIPRTNSTGINLIAVGDGNLNAASVAFTNTSSNTMRHEITISTGMVTVSANVTGVSNHTSGTILFTGAGQLKLGGTIFSATDGTLTTTDGSTVVYYATGNQTVGNFTYSNLTLSGSGTKTTTGITVNGILSMEGTATASFAPVYGPAATLQYNTQNARTAGIEWISPFAGTGGIIITNIGVITINSAKVFNTLAPLTLNSGASFSTGNYSLTLGGNFINNGATFTSTSSPFIITGTAATQNIAGFSTTGNVSFTKTSGIATLTGNIQAGLVTVSYTGMLNLGTGLIHSAGTLTLGSTGQPAGSYGGTGSGATFIYPDYFTASTGILNVSTSSCVPGSWTGYTNTDWNTGSNWCDGSVPVATTNVLINPTSNQPVISAAAFCNNITINAGASLTITGTNTLTLGGNWSNNGAFASGSGTVTMIGSANTLGGNSTTTFYNLTLGNGTVQGYTLGISEVVNGVLNFQNNTLLTLGANNLTLGVSSSYTGTFNSGCMIVTNGVGNLQLMNILTNTPIIIPVGDGTNYSPLTLNFNTTGTIAAGATVSVKVTNGKQPNNTSPTNYLNRYWTISQTGITGFKADLTGTFVSTDIVGSPNNQVAGIYVGALPWLRYAPLVSNTLTALGITAFGDFTAINTVPSVTISPAALTGFSYPVGYGPSQNQLFTVSGDALTTNITVLPTDTFEVSLTSGALFAPQSLITLPVNYGTVLLDTIYVRMKAGFNVGTIAPVHAITCTTDPSITQKVICSGTVISLPLITVTPGTPLSGFNYNVGGASTAQSFSVTGANLTSSVTITAPTDYKVCLATGGTYATSLTLPSLGGIITATNIFVKLNPGLSMGIFDENIRLTATNAVTQSVLCNGSVTLPTINMSTSLLGGFVYNSGSGPSSVQSFTVNGINLTAAATVLLTAPTNFEIGLMAAGPYSPTITLNQTSGSVATTTIYLHLKTGLAVNSYTGNLTAASTGAIQQNLICSGQVFASGAAPGILCSVTTLNGFVYTLGHGCSVVQSFTVSGTSLANGGITVTPTSSNYEICLTSNGSYVSAPLLISGTSVNAQPVYVRLKTGLDINTYPGTISLTSGTASQTVSIGNGKVIAVPVITAGPAGLDRICNNSPVILTSNGSGYDNQYWTGVNSLYSVASSYNLGTVTPANDGIYKVTATALSGTNLLVNGDFESGNTGFGTSYQYVTPSPTALSSGGMNGATGGEGNYTVTNSAYPTPHSVHNGFSACVDHTLAPGAYQMVVNGANSNGIKAWSESVTVDQNTEYQFNYWVQTVSAAGNPAQLQFYMNGAQVGPVYTATNATCDWIQFIYNVNSGSNTVLQLSIINWNAITGGNDFALDDLQFEQAFPATDSVNLVVNPPLSVYVGITATSNPLYSGAPVTFIAHPTNGGTSPGYQWIVNGLPAVNSSNSQFYSYVPAGNDSIRCIMTSNYPCWSGTPTVTSNTLTAIYRTNFWLGTTTSTDWGTSSNWTAGYVPAAGADVEFATNENNNNQSAQNDLVLDQNRTIGSLINSTGRQLFIPAGKGLIVNNTITTDSDVNRIYIQSSDSIANGSLIFHNADSIPVFATVEMYSKAFWNLSFASGNQYKWQFFGIPLRSVVANPTFYGSYVRRLDETGTTSSNHWIQLGNASVLTSFLGYELVQQFPSTIVFQGKLENGDFNSGQLVITPNAVYPGQYLFANPYTAAIDIRQLNFGTQTEATVYLYNTGSFADWTTNGGQNNTGTNPGQYTAVPKNEAGNLGIPRQVPSMQAMLVKALSNSVDATFGVSYNSVVMNNTDLQRVKANTLSSKVCCMIDVMGTHYSDRMWIFSEPNCTHLFDNGWDGTKMLGSSMTPQLFAMESDGNYQIDAVDDMNGTNLGFQTGMDTTYTLTFTQSNTKSMYLGLYLIDKVANKAVDISESGSTYSFTAQSTNQPVNRFMIVTRPTDPNSPGTDSNLKIFSSKGSILVQNFSSLTGEIMIYDLAGHYLKYATVGPFGGITMLSGFIPGVFIANAATSRERVTKKIIIK